MDNFLAGPAHLQAIARDVLDVGWIGLHVLGLDPYLLLLFLRRFDLCAEGGFFLLIRVRALDDRYEEKRQSSKHDQSGHPLRDRDKGGPDVAPVAALERDAGGVKEAGAGHGGLLQSASEDGVVAEFFFDAQKLIVLGETVAA